MKHYIEKISEELKESIVKFLEDNKEPIVDYYVWQESLELYKKACNEIRKSVSGFEQEFDLLIQYYKNKHKEDVLTYNEISLINDVNTKLKSLYNRYVKNENIWILLDRLLSKKYGIND